MPVIEVTQNTDIEGIADSFADGIGKRAKEYFNINIENPRIAKIYTIDQELSSEDINLIVEKIFKSPIKNVSVNKSFLRDFDYIVWWGLKPGVKDNEGEVTKEAIEFVLGRKIKGVYVSNILAFHGNISEEQVEKIVSLVANPNIERWEIIKKQQWNPDVGIGPRTSEVKLNKGFGFRYINLDISDEEFEELNEKNNWALYIEDFHYIKDYFYNNPDFEEQRKKVGLEKHPTDVEIECLAQALSDHCAHRTFHGKFIFGHGKIVDDPFKTFIKIPTEAIAEKNQWVVSVLKDNAGAMFLDREGKYILAIKGETHNSPSNKEPYGGAYTGIAGIFRDIMGFGKGAKNIMSLYGFVVGPRNYNGILKPEVHPNQLLDGVIAGVRDGGNKHGVPTVFGNIFFNESYIGKSLVYVTTVGVSERVVPGSLIDEKNINPGDVLLVYGGRTGIDGIHGVTEASMQLSEKITMGHVQKGDSYIQRKVSELLEDAVQKGLINLSWDLGGGGLSSAVTETAKFSGGVKVNLENILLKYEGMDLWQIWVSESQERMLAAVPKNKVSEFLELAKLHDVEVSVMGEYTNSKAVHILHNGKTCAYLPLELLYKKPPQWRFEAEWIPPENRLSEPVISDFKNHGELLRKMLSRLNICSKEWVARQYDHEVRGGSAIKHMIGVEQDVQGSAAVVCPVLGRKEGIAISQVLNPVQSKIDTYWMTMNIIDEALRRVASVAGINFNCGSLERVGAVDNFCWPEIRYSKENPDGKYKAAQLIRSLEALKEFQEKMGLPFLSGKDSMYIDGKLLGEFGEKHKISGLPCLQITIASVVDNIEDCITSDLKFAGDIIYIIGKTKNELGASEFYDMFGYTGLNIPKVDIEVLKNNLMAVSEAIKKGLLASAQPVARGGLIVDICKKAIAGDKGAEIDLAKIDSEGINKDFQLLYSESASRFLVTLQPENKGAFEEILKKYNCSYSEIGKVINEKYIIVKGIHGKTIIKEELKKLRDSYKSTFGSLI